MGESFKLPDFSSNEGYTPLNPSKSVEGFTIQPLSSKNLDKSYPNPTEKVEMPQIEITSIEPLNS